VSLSWTTLIMAPPTASLKAVIQRSRC